VTVALRHPVSPAEIQHFALATGAVDRMHHDSAVAWARGYRDVVAPPNFFSAIALSMGRTAPPEQLRADGLAAADQLTGRVVAGGTAVRWHGAICAGDVLVVTEEHLPHRQQASRHGTLVIHSITRRYLVADRLVVEERADRVAIPLAPHGPGPADDRNAGAAASDGQAAKSPANNELIGADRQPGELDLFMFCAATWLTHRIHFDRDYARSEGYRDLVVPGPYQNALLGQFLADFAAAHGGTLDYLEVRHRAPAFCGAPLRLSAAVAETNAGPRTAAVTLNVSVSGPAGVVHTSGRAGLTLTASATVLGLLGERSVA
jgi:hydroxyacyl-ACP dehydratase HTD2-like protein with hotdog domain